MLVLEDLYVATQTKRYGLVETEALRGLLKELAGAAERTPLVRALHERLELPMDKARGLHDMAQRYLRQRAEDRYRVHLLGGGFALPEIDALLEEQRAANLSWLLGERLVREGRLPAARHQEILQQLQRELRAEDANLIAQNCERDFVPILGALPHESPLNARFTGKIPTYDESDVARMLPSGAAPEAAPEGAYGGGDVDAMRTMVFSGALALPVQDAGGGAGEDFDDDDLTFDITLPSMTPEPAPSPHDSSRGSGVRALGTPVAGAPVDFTPSFGDEGVDAERTMTLSPSDSGPIPSQRHDDLDGGRTITLPAGATNGLGSSGRHAAPPPQGSQAFGVNDPTTPMGIPNPFLPGNAPPGDPNLTQPLQSPFGPGGSGSPGGPPIGVNDPTTPMGIPNPFQAGGALSGVGGPRPSDPDLIGGRYRIERELGRGAMGVVHLAHDPERGPVALKLVQGPATAEVKGRFDREIAVSQRTRHAHVIEVFDYGELPDKSSYMVMEVLEGDSLKGILVREGAQSIERSLALLQQLLEGLAAVHASGIVHRDLKPENLQILNRDGADHVKIVDFGISRFLDAEEGEAEQFFQTMRGKLSGTPQYVAPEAVLEPDLITTSHDVYACGVILYELLTGVLPFPPARSLRDMLSDTVNSRARPLDEANPDKAPYPPDLERFVRRLLEKDPELRPADAGAALELLTEFRAERAAPEESGSFTARFFRSITGFFKRG